jgi:hypothetical protein
MSMTLDAWPAPPSRSGALLSDADPKDKSESNVLFSRGRTEIAEQELPDDESTARDEAKELAPRLRAQRSTRQFCIRKTRRVFGQ